MSWYIVSWLLVAGSSLAGLVFVLAFRFALREATMDLPGWEATEGHMPAASLHQARMLSRNPWHRGLMRQRLIRAVRISQGCLVAFGITAVFVMLMCMAAIFAAMIISCL